MDKSLSRYYARKIWENHYQACILPGMQIHHRDGNPYNNEIENLVVCSSEEHIEFHRQLGHSIQPNFIARADFYNNLTFEEKESFKQKCAEAGRKGKGTPRPHSAELGKLASRPLEMVETKTGKIIDEFSSVSDAAEKLGIQRAHIRRVIKKERKAWHDYEFRYKET